MFVEIVSASRVPPTHPALALAPRKAPQEALRKKRWKLRKGSPGGAKIQPQGVQRPPRRAPGASWAPDRPQMASKAALRPPLGDSWGALGALLGSSWGRLGSSWVAPGPSWAAPGGHFGLPGVTFSRFLVGFFGGLARGLEKTRFSMFLWCFLSAVLLSF